MRASSAPVAASSDGTMVGALLGAVGAEHPFGIGIDPEPCRHRAAVPDHQPRDLHRIGGIDGLRQLDDQSAARRAEDADSPGRAAPRRSPPGRATTAANGENARCRRLVEDVDRFARPVAHRIVDPRRQLEVAAVAAPGEGRALGRGVEAERRLAMTLIQGCGVERSPVRRTTYSRPPSAKPPIAVPEGEVGAVRLGGRGDAAQLAAGRTMLAASISCGVSVDGRQLRGCSSPDLGALDLVEDRCRCGCAARCGRPPAACGRCARPSGRGAPRRCAGAGPVRCRAGGCSRTATRSPAAGPARRTRPAR